MTQEINGYLLESMAAYSRNMLPDEEFHAVNLKSLLGPAFTKVINKIIFGVDEEHKVDGMDLPIAIQKQLNELFAISTKPINVLTLDILHNWSILPETRQSIELLDKIEIECLKQYQNRLKSGPKPTPNLIDLLISKNKELLASGRPELTRREITGHFIVL